MQLVWQFNHKEGTVVRWGAIRECLLVRYNIGKAKVTIIMYIMQLYRSLHS